MTKHATEKAEQPDGQTKYDVPTTPDEDFAIDQRGDNPKRANAAPPASPVDKVVSLLKKD
ncbi:hypothetical protein JANAI62_23940 [Jannaschia pagri]|uniref:Uncharacterized protein n=1 Tax=Jannaschia pagri TaxID=2829797 RepID=A0ABQ4NMZ9_9RHOB|nr:MULTISPECIES: hypothetical protein [unclassified Jannaschia]GIT91937.1 hypothetical protein JANAI61_23950 [Jannaschia sp. AI_61]GIT95771.1 hypothetical protein JANAI62_23940 [Jannaschia sp. AI_62]